MTVKEEAIREVISSVEGRVVFDDRNDFWGMRNIDRVKASLSVSALWFLSTDDIRDALMEAIFYKANNQYTELTSFEVKEGIRLCNDRKQVVISYVVESKKSDENS